MKDFSFYEQVGVILPGATLLAGLVIAFPQLQPLLVNKDVTVGALGLFVIFAYVAGHLIAAIGNAVEKVLWLPFGGMPSAWPRFNKPRVISPAQRDQLQDKIKSRLKLAITIRGCGADEWRKTFGLIYRDVLANETPKRVEAFNGNYDLNRGLASASIVSAGLLYFVPNGHPWWWALIAGGAAAAFLFRAYRFGVYFAQEVYFRFLLKPDA